MKQSQTLVEYRDSEDAQSLVFGPFYNTAIASAFASELPKPLKGGFKRYRVTQPFTLNDTSIVRDLIISKRA